MDLLQMGSQLLASQAGSDTGSADVSNILGSLIGDGDSMNIGSLVQKMQDSGDLGTVVASWLGDGNNAAIDPSQLANVLDPGKLQQAASALGLDINSLLPMLASIIPQMVDKGSSGGSLPDSLGGSAAISGMVKGLFD